jgi:hypothetical protein
MMTCPFPSLELEELSHDQSAFPCSRSRYSQATSPRQGRSGSTASRHRSLYVAATHTPGRDSKTRELERDSSYSSRSRQARSASQELPRSNQRTEARSLCPTSQTKPKHREQPNLPARDKRTTVATTTLTGTVTSTGSILRLPTLDNLAGRSEQGQKYSNSGREFHNS